ncbi:hypothetical protein N7456_011218 [Penicillium angulare]|uniref:Uncharacterized protein n=1 Tax=Penicillium angulare TaxID=116970 RepID=A0A9W9K0H6_9EURO|nr:hypothetical protein N7456_011218 [Penicillium angulare]
MARKSIAPAWISKIRSWVRRQFSKVPGNRKKPKAQRTWTASADFSTATPFNSPTALSPSSSVQQDPGFTKRSSLRGKNKARLTTPLHVTFAPDPSKFWRSTQRESATHKYLYLGTRKESHPRDSSDSESFCKHPPGAFSGSTNNANTEVDQSINPSIDLKSDQDCGCALDKQPDTPAVETTLNL